MSKEMNTEELTINEETLVRAAEALQFQYNELHAKMLELAAEATRMHNNMTISLKDRKVKEKAYDGVIGLYKSNLAAIDEARNRIKTELLEKYAIDVDEEPEIKPDDPDEIFARAEETGVRVSSDSD